MIRAIDNKPLELSDEEFEYYLLCIKEFGEKVFQNTFEVDENENSPYYGFITLVKPPFNTTTPMGAIFFLFNVEMNQRMREIERVLAILKEKAK